MSATPRLFVDEDLRAGAEIALDKGASHYLLTVLRLSTGAELRVFNGRDGEWRARLSEAGRKSAAIALEAQTREQLSAPDLHLLFAPVKKARTDFIVEKATELGARLLQPVMTARTQSERVRVDRLEALVREAAEQTERLDLPEIRAPEKLERLLGAWDPARRLIFCDEAGDAPDAPWGGAQGRAQPMADALRAATPSAAGWAILIGPEGGFSPEERARLRALDYAVPVSLGPRILRADTAAAAALSVWQAELGDWRTPLTRA